MEIKRCKNICESLKLTIYKQIYAYTKCVGLKTLLMDESTSGKIRLLYIANRIFSSTFKIKQLKHRLERLNYECFKTDFYKSLYLLLENPMEWEKTISNFKLIDLFLCVFNFVVLSDVTNKVSVLKTYKLKECNLEKRFDVSKKRMEEWGYRPFKVLKIQGTYTQKLKREFSL